ncbi:MAG: glycoside hydrolase family 16 protein [Clostridia bacterium]
MKIKYKKITATILLMFLFCSALIGCIKTPKMGAKIDLSGMELVFEDEFNTGKLDTAKWTTEKYNNNKTPHIRRGGYWDSQQVSFDSDNLLITTEFLPNGKYGAGWYTGMINTNNINEFKYGYFEIRCKAPKAEGLWSAFWLQADKIGEVTGDGKNGTEIDILETPYFNDKKSGLRLKNTVFHTLHTDGYADNHKSTTSGFYKVENDIYDEFNTYGVRWTKDGYVFYINGLESWSTSWLGNSQVEQFIILSVEIAGENANPANPNNKFCWSGEIENNSGKFRTSQFVVDYVKVYQDKING